MTKNQGSNQNCLNGMHWALWFTTNEGICVGFVVYFELSKQLQFYLQNFSFDCETVVTNLFFFQIFCSIFASVEVKNFNSSIMNGLTVLLVTKETDT